MLEKFSLVAMETSTKYICSLYFSCALLSNFQECWMRCLHHTFVEDTHLIEPKVEPRVAKVKYIRTKESKNSKLSQSRNIMGSIKQSAAANAGQISV